MASIAPAGGVSREALDLAEPALQPATIRVRDRMWADFRRASQDVEFLVLANPTRPLDVARALVAYGQQLHDEGAAISRFRNTILTVQDRAPELRGALARAWRALAKWQALEPSSSHLPITRKMILAWTAVSIIGGQFEFAALLLIGFVGCLRPGELLQLTRRDICLPEDFAGRSDVCFVALTTHKTRNGRTLDGAQHTTIRDRNIINYLRWVLRDHAPDDCVYSGTTYRFTRLWKQLCEFFGVLAKDKVGYTPASLRAGGATFLYVAGVPLGDIRWQLRHATEQSVRRYVQASAAAFAQARLSALSQGLVARFAAGAASLLHAHARHPPRLLRALRWDRDADEPDGARAVGRLWELDRLD